MKLIYIGVVLLGAVTGDLFYTGQFALGTLMAIGQLFVAVGALLRDIKEESK